MNRHAWYQRNTVMYWCYVNHYTIRWASYVLYIAAAAIEDPHSFLNYTQPPSLSVCLCLKQHNVLESIWWTLLKVWSDSFKIWLNIKRSVVFALFLYVCKTEFIKTSVFHNIVTHSAVWTFLVVDWAAVSFWVHAKYFWLIVWLVCLNSLIYKSIQYDKIDYSVRNDIVTARALQERKLLRETAPEDVKTGNLWCVYVWVVEVVQGSTAIRGSLWSSQADGERLLFALISWRSRRQGRYIVIIVEW